MEQKIFFMMPLAFVCEFIDSSLGMGYGTTLTPVLLLMGYEPLMIVPAVLFSEFVSGILAACFHHNHNNVRFHRNSMDTKVALVLTGFSVFGAVISVVIAVRLPGTILKLWISMIVVCMAVLMILTRLSKPKFSWSKIITLGSLASFNKGMSGGGYGPLVMSGQILSGVGVKNAIGITSLAEGVTCFAGVVMYIFFFSKVDWTLAPWLMAGAALSVPVATYAVKRFEEKKLKLIIAGVVFLLGLSSLIKVIFSTS